MPPPRSARARSLALGGIEPVLAPGPRRGQSRQVYGTRAALGPRAPVLSRQDAPGGTAEGGGGAQREGLFGVWCPSAQGSKAWGLCSVLASRGISRDRGCLPRRPELDDRHDIGSHVVEVASLDGPVYQLLRLPRVVRVDPCGRPRHALAKLGTPAGRVAIGMESESEGV